MSLTAGSHASLQMSTPGGFLVQRYTNKGSYPCFSGGQFPRYALVISGVVDRLAEIYTCGNRGWMANKQNGGGMNSIFSKLKSYIRWLIYKVDSGKRACLLLGMAMANP